MSDEPTMHAETTRFILNFTKDAPKQQLADVDAMDTKAMSVFGVASTIIGLAAFAFAGGGGWNVTGVLLPATLSYAVVAVSVFISVRAHEYTGGQYASWLWRNCWADSVEDIEHTLAAAIPKAFEENLRTIRSKARWLGMAMYALAAETGFIAAALLVSRF